MNSTPQISIFVYSAFHRGRLISFFPLMHKLFTPPADYVCMMELALDGIVIGIRDCRQWPHCHYGVD